MTKHLRLLSIFFFTFLLFEYVYAQQDVYKKLKIYGSVEDMKSLALQGVCMDHGDGKPNTWFSSYFNSNEFNIIKKSGLKYDVLIEDARANYQEGYKNKNASLLSGNGICPHANEPEYPTPAHFKFGSMGGFPTYAEMISELDSMTLLFPNLITAKQSIGNGTTWEGDSIFYLKISDNPGLDETEPEVYYSALHHAREPLSMHQMLYFMWYLLENYQTDSLVKNLVNNRELYFLPCINPDGYKYNEFTDPNGGGLWRKNRRDNLGGIYGVDLNRNYGAFWGFDNYGSSPDSASDVYRGPSPFSEPETQLVRDFINTRQFVTAMDYHTYGDHILLPYSYGQDIYTPDSAVFVALCETYTEYNDYTYGTCNQVLNYVANGGSIDWQYAEQSSKPKIFDFTPELGYDFWPQPSDIVGIIQTAIHTDFMTALVAGKYAKVYDKTPPAISGVNGYLHFELLQLGLDTVGSYTVSVTGISPQISTTGNAKTYANLNFMQTVSDSISYTLGGQQVNGTELKFLVSIDFGNYKITDTITKYYGIPVILVSDNGTTMSNWASGSGWGLTTSAFYSPGSCITDSPLGNYQPLANNELVLTNPVNLGQSIRAGLSFNAKWQTQSNRDYVEVRVSDDGGVTWTPLCGKYTHPGTFNEDYGQPVFDAVKQTWVQEEMSLNSFAGKNITIEFILVSNGNDEYDGFYFDDFKVWTLNTNVGIDETQNPVYLGNAYPNPTTNSTHISYAVPLTGKYELIVCNTLGQKMFTEVLDPQRNSTTLNPAGFAGGVYYCKLTCDGRVFGVRRLVVMK